MKKKEAESVWIYIVSDNKQIIKICNIQDSAGRKKENEHREFSQNSRRANKTRWETEREVKDWVVWRFFFLSLCQQFDEMMDWSFYTKRNVLWNEGKMV